MFRLQLEFSNEFKEWTMNKKKIAACDDVNTQFIRVAQYSMLRGGGRERERARANGSLWNSA